MSDDYVKMGSSSSSAGLLLRVCRSNGHTDEFYLANGLTIGRTVANTVVLADDTVDRTHARVDLTEDGAARLRCVGSDNKLSVGDTAVQEIGLTAGVRFRIGTTDFECVSGRKGPESERTSRGSNCPSCGSRAIPVPCAKPIPCLSCGQPILVLDLGFGRPSPLVIPVRYGEFLADRYVARGGMGLVLRGSAEWDERPVAIKVLLPSEGDDRQATDRFQQEITLMKKVSHANVVGLLSCGRAGPFSFLVMNWIEGRSLRDTIMDFKECQQQPRFVDVIHWFEQVCEGLAAIHTVGIIHRDIKPSNILIAKDGHVLISDLGIGKPADANQTALTTTGQLPGTYEYMAPEQLSAPDTVDRRTDLYALGVTFYELLTGDRPMGVWLPASESNPTVLPVFDQVLSRLLARRPEDRYSDIHEVLAAAAVLKPSRVTAKVEPGEEPAPLPDKITRAIMLEEERPQTVGGGLSALPDTAGVVDLLSDTIACPQPDPGEQDLNASSLNQVPTATSPARGDSGVAIEPPPLNVATNILWTLTSDFTEPNVSLPNLSGEDWRLWTLTSDFTEPNRATAPVDSVSVSGSESPRLSAPITWPNDRLPVPLSLRSQVATTLRLACTEVKFICIATIATIAHISLLVRIAAIRWKIHALEKKLSEARFRQADHRVVVGIQTAIKAHRDEVAALKPRLQPPTPVSWCRIGIGYATMVTLVIIAITWAISPRHESVAVHGAGGKALPKELTVDLGGGVKLEMVLIPRGEFLMGSRDSDSDANSDEKPQHRVRITKPFYLGKYQVTQEQWEAVMGSNPSHFTGPKNPVENVSWEDCQQFLGKLNATTGTQDGKFVLPTEVQWEYACRAGSTTHYCFGDKESELGEYAWYNGNAHGKAHPVGEKKSNAWGLYDMHGKVYDWCADWYDRGYYANSQTDDPMGPATGSLRVCRGGDWFNNAGSCRSAYRCSYPPGGMNHALGLRVSLVPAQ